MNTTARRWSLVTLLLCAVVLSPTAVTAYDVRDYEEAGGLSVSGVRSTDGDVYGGGFESGVWLKGLPVFGEIFGHWLANRLQDANYYSIGMTLRLMPRYTLAPFAGVGASYSGLTSERNRRLDAGETPREPDRSYWKAHAEGGLRVWFGPGGMHFLEGSYRQHWTETGSDFNYSWISLEYGMLF